MKGCVSMGEDLKSIGEGRGQPARLHLEKMVVLLSLGLLLITALASCASPGLNRASTVAFDTATVWIHQGSDSTGLLVEVASRLEQQEVGLAGRPSLEAESGMLFEFDEARSGDDGFWMWRTLVPLDIAFVDEDGVIRRILSMEVCESDDFDLCTGYFPEIEYVSAIETNRGWFADKRIDEGARVVVIR